MSWFTQSRLSTQEVPQGLDTLSLPWFYQSTRTRPRTESSAEQLPVQHFSLEATAVACLTSPQLSVLRQLGAPKLQGTSEATEGLWSKVK